MTSRLLISFLFFCSASFSQSWQQVQVFPGVERDDAIGFVIGNKGYVGTGLITGWQPTSDFYSFDFNTETWSQVSSLPIGNERQYAVGFSNNGLGYVFGGMRGTTFLRDLWCYDPGTNQWTLKTSLPGKSRAGSTGFVADNKFYLLGGVDSSDVILDEVWIYDIPSDQWYQATSAMPTGLWRASATEYQGEGYVLFGKETSGLLSNTLYRYNAPFDSWSYNASFPGQGRTYSALSSVENNLVIIGGLDSSDTSYADMWLYNFTNWVQKPSLPAAPRRGGVLLSHLWNVYYSTGINNQNVRLKETWKVNSVTGVKEEQVERFNVYPNPANDCIQLSGCSDKLSYKIYNHVGEMVMEGETSEAPIAISELSGGVYYLKIESKVVRFVKF